MGVNCQRHHYNTEEEEAKKCQTQFLTIFDQACFFTLMVAMMHSIVRHHGHHPIFKLKDQNGRGKNGLLPQSWDLGPELFW